MSETHVNDLLPAYALGSLDPEEALLVSEHLAHCLSCQEAQRAYRDIVDSLPLATPLVEPPADLRKRILAIVQGEAARRPVDEKPGWRGRLRGLFRRATPAWGVLGLALILLLGVSNLLLWQRLRDAPAPASFTVLTMRGTEASPQAEALLILDAEGSIGTLIANRLDPLEGAQEYQLWLIEGEERSSAGVFSVNERGYGRLYVSLPEPLSTYSGLGITIEPAGGSPGPTGPKVLGIDL